MTESKSAIINAALPKNPTDGDLYKVPGGGSVGGSTVIYLTNAKDENIGTATQIIPVINVSGRYTVMRPSTNRPMKIGDVIKVIAKQYHYNVMTFLNYYGWVAKESTIKPLVLESAIYQISHIIPVGDVIRGYYLYERLCLELIKEY